MDGEKRARYDLALPNQGTSSRDIGRRRRRRRQQGKGSHLSDHFRLEQKKNLHCFEQPKSMKTKRVARLIIPHVQHILRIEPNQNEQQTKTGTEQICFQIQFHCKHQNVWKKEEQKLNFISSSSSSSSTFSFQHYIFL